MPTEVIREPEAGTPNNPPVRVNRCENVKRIFDIPILRFDPSNLCLLGSIQADNRVE